MQTGTLLTAAVACGLAFGCSSSGSGGGTKVTGTVTFNGSPVANARVIFTDGGAPLRCHPGQPLSPTSPECTPSSGLIRVRIRSWCTS